MKFGFIPQQVMATDEWYICDENGIIISKGGSAAHGYESVLKVNRKLPPYWVETCSRWYDSIEELCEAHTAEML